MQTTAMVAEQELRAGPVLVAAAQAEAEAHTEFFAKAQAEDPDFAGSVYGRYCHNLANIACGWVTEAEPRYMADFMKAVQA